MKAAHENTEIKWVEALVEDHTHCCLCGTALQFETQVNHSENKVQEQASCPSCHVQLRQQEHSLQ